MEPQLMGPYGLLEPLGQGGMGMVWRAEPLHTRATAALKTGRDAQGRLPESRFAQAAGCLRRAQQLWEAGAGERLFRGQLWEDLPEGLRRCIEEAGQLGSTAGEQ